jgi:hypothetical protein
MAAILASCGGESGETTAPSGPPPERSEQVDPGAEPDGADAAAGGPGTGGHGGAGGRRGAGDEPADAAEERRRRAARRAERLYRDYVAAINDRDGGRLCALLAPGTWRELRPPVRGPDCAGSLTESIGFSDRRGYPVWAETVLSGFEQVQTDAAGTSARVTASVVTRFADRTQPSVESDVAFFARSAGGWKLAKPSGVLWRAVGKPEYPPSVLSPP